MASERRQVRWLRRDAVSALLAAEHQRPYDLPSQTFALLTPPCTPTLVVPPACVGEAAAPFMRICSRWR